MTPRSRASMSRIALIGIALLFPACASSTDPPSPTSAPATTTPPSSTTTGATTPIPSTSIPTTSIPTTTEPAAPTVPEPLAGFDLTTVGLGGGELLVAVADDPRERAQGLMFVDSLGDLDGMLFVFESDVLTGFWMKDTLISLDIAFFSADGVLIDGFTMEPCEADPCPLYRPGGPYRYALEMPAGTMVGGVPELVVDG